VSAFDANAVLVFVRFMDLAGSIFGAAMTIFAALSPRIPPFVGYFLCHLTSYNGMDPCGMSRVGIKELLRLTFAFLDITMVFRIVSGTISALVYIPGSLAANQMATYEVLPSLLLQKESLVRLTEMVKSSYNARLSDTNQLARNYRQLQLINTVFNEIYGRDFFAIVMLVCTLALVSSGFFLLTSYHHIHYFVLVVLGFTTFMEYSFSMTLFTVASKVWNASVEFKQAWRRNLQFSKQKVARRVGRNFRNLKINIGSSNFVERNTPFVYISFCIEQTITLVLMRKV
jgi:hypothetical protein